MVDRARGGGRRWAAGADRKSTRLNSSHLVISYAVFCLKKKQLPCNVECGLLLERKTGPVSRRRAREFDRHLTPERQRANRRTAERKSVSTCDRRHGVYE